MATMHAPPVFEPPPAFQGLLYACVALSGLLSILEVSYPWKPWSVSKWNLSILVLYSVGVIITSVFWSQTETSPQVTQHLLLLLLELPWLNSVIGQFFLLCSIWRQAFRLTGGYITVTTVIIAICFQASGFAVSQAILFPIISDKISHRLSEIVILAQVLALIGVIIFRAFTTIILMQVWPKLPKGKKKWPYSLLVLVFIVALLGSATFGSVAIAKKAGVDWFFLGNNIIEVSVNLVTVLFQLRTRVFPCKDSNAASAEASFGNRYALHSNSTHSASTISIVRSTKAPHSNASCGAIDHSNIVERPDGAFGSRHESKEFSNWTWQTPTTDLDYKLSNLERGLHGTGSRGSGPTGSESYEQNTGEGGTISRWDRDQNSG